MTEHLVALGVISGAHGIRGQVKIKTFTGYAEDIAAYGALQDSCGKIYDITVTSVVKEGIVACVAGVTDRTQAEKLKNKELYIERSRLPAPEEDEYYYTDLIGLEVYTSEQALYGKVVSINNYGAGDIVEIALPAGETALLPFTRATFFQINIKEKKILVNLPEAIS